MNDLPFDRIRDQLSAMALCCAVISLGMLAAISRETLSSTTFDVPEVSRLELELVSDGGQTVLVSIDRRVEDRRIPIVVVYEIESTSQPLSQFKWSVTQQDAGLFYIPAATQIRSSSDGRTASIMLSSNRPQFEVCMEATSQAGRVFWGQDVLRCTLDTGERIRLGSSDSISTAWTQVFANADSFEYVTQNRVQVERDQSGCYFVPRWPGNYRFINDESDDMTVIEAYVGMQTDRELTMRGTFVADYYGSHWVPPDNVNIDREIILATTGLAKNLGANTFCVVNFWKVMQWYPIPLFCSTEGGPSISMTTLNAIGDACDSLGLDLYLHLGNYTPWPYMYAEEDARYWDSNSNDAEWYARYFDEVERFAQYNLQGAADAGIDYFTAQARSGNMYIGDNFEIYSLNHKCEQLIGNIRDAYAGDYGWCAPYPERGNRFLDNCDFVHLFLNWRDQFRVGSFRDDAEPTPSEVREATREYLSRYEGQLPPGIDVFVNVSALSADSQVSVRGEAEGVQTDYQEQVAFLEGFFQAVHETSWITGTIVWNLFWLDWNAELAEIMGDQTYNSIRGKPAEEVVRLWFNVLGG